MSIPCSILSSLRIAGMISGAYIGFEYGNTAKDILCKNFPKLEYIKKEYISPKFYRSKMSENTFFNIVGFFSGILSGNYLWPICIPITINLILNKY